MTRFTPSTSKAEAEAVVRQWMANLKRTIDRITVGIDPYNLTQNAAAVDFSQLAYAGPCGVPVPGATEEIKRYVALAEREMRKKASRRHK